MPALKEPIVKNVELHGITLAQRPSLAAHVLYDELHPIKGKPGQEDVSVQTRISRSDQTGKLDVDLRVINHGSKPAKIAEVLIRNLAKVPNLHFTFADWRPDGLGTVAPKYFVACIVPTGTDMDEQQFGFNFDHQEIPVGGSTRFFFLSTNATHIDPSPNSEHRLWVTYDTGVPTHAWAALMPNFLPPA